MKVKQVYQCEFCLTEYKSREDAIKCEAECLKLTLDEYNEYMELLKEERNAFGSQAYRMNDEIRDRVDKAVKAVINFQKKHGIEDAR